MDHISSLLHNTPSPNDMNISRGIPTFDDTPLEPTPEPVLSPITNTNSPSSSPSTTETTKTVSTDTPALDIADIKKRLYLLKDEIASIIRTLEIGGALPEYTSGTQTMPRGRTPSTEETHITISSGEKIIEGTFTGEKMRGPDGQEYAVPPNYASKSKLVEGDRMKLTITTHGKFIYKQIGPIERKRIIGILQFDESTQLWSVIHEGRMYHILTASATFYHGKPGDHVVILVPKDIPCSWGAVENIIAS